MVDEVLPISDEALAELMDASQSKETRVEAFIQWYETFGEAKVRKYVAWKARTHIEDPNIDDFISNACGRAYKAVCQAKFQYQGTGFTAYVKAFAENEYFSQWRKEGRHQKLVEKIIKDVEITAKNVSVEEALIQQQGGEFLSNCLTYLKQPRQEIIRLYYFEECSFKEIGARLEISPSTARKEKQRALERLRTFMGIDESDIQD